MILGLIHAAAAFWRTKALVRRLRTPEDVRAWREARLKKFVSGPVRDVPFYQGARAFADLPIIDKQAVLANFEQLNRRRVTLAVARAALDAERERVGGLVVGQSTGTSGNRGVFVISEAERFTWLGVMLAKTLPDFPFVRHKVALALPGYSQLYASAEETGRLAIRFFDLALGVEAWRDELRAFAPDTIVAPPKVLRNLAEHGGLAPAHVFSGAEVLDPTDRAVIEAGFGARVREIYMATEGLFGVACPHGTLHLAEDVVAFEWEAAPGETGLVMPIVTDFTRRTQIMARYRMNDLLRLSSLRCACGSPLQAVAAVEGRRDDMLRLPGRAGTVMITPDVARNAVVDADRRIDDFRVVQTGEAQIVLTLAEGLPAEAAELARSALTRALSKAGVRPVEIRLEAGIGAPTDRKLRRVRCDLSPPAG
ncbi:adenylate synthase [soil metagenome]